MIIGRKNISKKILEMLEERNIEYEIVKHPETIGVEDSKAIGHDPEEVVKSLILKGKKSNKNILLVLRGDRRIDFRLLKTKFKEYFTFEEARVIKIRWGLSIGEVPPFGNILGLDTFFDKTILEKGKIFFTIADKTKSVRISSKDLLQLLDAELI